MLRQAIISFSDACMVMLAVLSRNNKLLYWYSYHLTTDDKFDEFAQERECKYFCMIIVLSLELPCLSEQTSFLSLC